MKFKLSICVPTYNRAKFMRDLFESIICQIDKNTEELIEIVVSDNASTDNTKEIIDFYKNKFKNFVYFKWDKNMGADRNYLKCVEIANGEFCWLMGSDDVIEKGGIDYVLESLRETPDVVGISVNRYAYDYSLKNRLREKPIAYGKLTFDFLFTEVEDIVYYLGDYFGYISGQIINKRLWDNILEINRYKISEYFNAYVHIFVIFNMINKKPYWKYISKRCVGWRSNNDSFLSDVFLNRIKLDIIGYEKIAGDVFGRDSKAYHSLMAKISTIHVFSYVWIGKMENKFSWDDYIYLFKKCLNYYYKYPKFWYKTFILLIVPTFVLKFLRFIYRKTFKKFIIKENL